MRLSCLGLGVLLIKKIIRKIQEREILHPRFLLCFRKIFQSLLQSILPMRGGQFIQVDDFFVNKGS